ncbi:MAG: helix-turn-helix transcriptional regulator [Spirochaetaceae bacterium]|nr:helix-turn-helix transcriptional regulator [Spirochaetaceae bacterium]
MVNELALVCAITVFLTVIAELKTRTKEISHILASVSKSGILSGAFVSIIQLIITISKYEQIIVRTIIIEETSIIKFVLMIFISCRPLLIGTGIKVIISGISWILKEDKESTIQDKTSDPFAVLSPREKEVARLAARGYSNAQIADELFISIETVKRHMATIFEKLGIESRRQLKGGDNK